MSPPSHSEGMVMRIETTRAPVPSQPELVLSDGKLFGRNNLNSTQNDTEHQKHI